ncbi:O-linked N-acetylglucosamine transferase, SPINDLY family protein [Allorhizobium undicola]|uniref:O-linked N-acetylglucosamine transferase, SPINDLY family protein n=1 Tax=Allorhizobium undicola TaxID=78527 RepID=UPI000685027E|nr:hypothetical protein [Allorhizobium undicola]
MPDLPPASAAEHLAAGITHYKAGALAEALAGLKAALALPGDHAGQAHMLCANIHLKQEDRLAAASHFLAAGRLIPQEAQKFSAFAARLYLQSGRADLLGAVAVEVAKSQPPGADLVKDMADALLKAGHHGELEALFPFLDMGNNWHLQLVSGYYQTMRRHDALRQLLLARYEATPDDSFVAMLYFTMARSQLIFPAMRQWQDMADLLQEQSQEKRAKENAVAAEILYRDPPLTRCYWSDDPAILASPSGAIDQLRKRLSALRPRRKVRPANEKLRIGYVSSDLYNHATIYLLYDVFVAHDRSRFDITFFCNTPAAARQAQKGWDPVLQAEILPVDHLDMDGLADEIARRGIDVLIDLKGHTSGSCGEAVAICDAPVKATWIGFPGSVRGLGLDYHITDPIVTPDAAKPWFEEKLCRLPDSYQGNCSVTKPRPRAESRAAHGLPEGAFIFGSFNSQQKITPQTMQLWAKVLHAVPDSLFWILCQGEVAQANLLAEFDRLGIGRERILLAEPIRYADHLSRVGLADLALDTFPYNGHTTTSDLLWGGLPVLTRQGETFAARVSQSLLSAIGLPELVAADEAGFVAEARRLAHDRPALAALRARLAENRGIMPLYDTGRFTRHLERAYEMMADRARAGLAPDHMDVPALAPRREPFL